MLMYVNKFNFPLPDGLPESMEFSPGPGQSLL